jgi:hypothetical protein
MPIHLGVTDMKITLIHKALTIIGLVVLIGAISSTEAKAALEQQAYFNQSLSPVKSKTVATTSRCPPHMVELMTGLKTSKCVTPREYYDAVANGGSEAAPSPRTEYEFRDVERAPIPIPKQYMDDRGNITTLTPLN